MSVDTGTELEPIPAELERPKINLHYAARDNRLEIVEKWIKFLEDVALLNKKDGDGYAPLHYAAKFNRHRILVKLIEAGADPNVRTREEKYTPLHFAARYIPRIIDKDVQLQEDQASKSGSAIEVGKLSTSAQVMQYLVFLRRGKKVKVNAKAQYGITPLHLASQRGNLAAVNVLLRSNEINVNIEDDNKDTALHEAALNGHHEIVEVMVKRMKFEDPDTMNIDPLNSESQSPLHLACREGHVEVVKSILKHVGAYDKRVALTKTRDNELNTALHLACESGDEEIVRILILNGADLYAKKLEDVCPIHIAARYGFKAISEVLISAAEEIVNSEEADNRTPLHYAAAHNQVEMIEFLISKKADVTLTDIDSLTPLMVAAQAGHVEAFNSLLNENSAIDETDDEGRTVIHLAAKENRVEVLKEVLKNADGRKLVNSTDSNYNTPLHLAAFKGNLEAIEELLKSASGAIKIDAKNELGKTPIHLAATKGHIPVIKALLKHKRDCILDEDEDGNTPLHLSALNGYYKSVAVLLNSEADFDAKNATLWTPMDCAAYNGHEIVVEVLIEAGADVNPTDKLQSIPLHLAAQEGHLNVVKVLLVNNADVGKCNSTNLNSLDLAIDNGHEDIALVIIQSKWWKEALRNTSKSPLGIDTTPLRKLIKKMPDVAEEVFNRCSVGNESKDGKIGLDSKEYMLTFNYEFLEDFRDEKVNVCTRFYNKLFKSRSIAVDAEEDITSVDLLEIKSRDDDDDEVDLISLDKKRSSKHNFTTFWGPIGFKKKLHPLSIMVEHNRTDLLTHPLVTSLLKLKWRTYGRTAYFLNLFIYIVFVTFITSFALVSLNPQSETCSAVFNGTFGNRDNTLSYEITETGCAAVANASEFGMFSLTDVCDNTTIQQLCDVPELSCDRCEGLSSVKRVFLFAAASIVIIMAVIRLLFEMFQAISLKIYYIFDWVNWLELTLFICSIIFVSVYRTDCLCPTDWQWQIGSVAVFLTWIDLIIFIRKLPLTGIYVLMFVHIFYTFCKMIILTALLIFAFSLAFYMTFFDPSDSFARSSFATPGRAIVKTMTMTTGEFEYDAIFRQFPGGSESDSITEEIPFPGVSFLIWIIFLILMPILLTNLLVGLAVDDIKGIQDAAVLKRLALQVELALSVEELLPIGLRRYFITEEFTVVPNRKLNFLEKIRYIVAGSESDRFDSQETISNALHPQPTPIEQVQQQSRKLILEMKSMKQTITDLAERNIVMERLIREMAKRQRISGTEDEPRTFL